MLPGIDLAAQEFSAADAPVQALAAQDANLDLRDVQPACMLGCVVEFDAPQEFRGGTRSQHVVEVLAEVGMQVVDDQVSSSLTKATKSILPRHSVTETIRCPAFGSMATNGLVVPLRV